MFAEPYQLVICLSLSAALFAAALILHSILAFWRDERRYRRENQNQGLIRGL